MKSRPIFSYLNMFAYRLVSRLISFVVAIFVLLITWPLILIFALLIKRDTPGPAIFRQTRVGKNRRKSDRRKRNQTVYPKECRQGQRRRDDFGGRPFTFYKFRTMYSDAKEQFSELYAYNYTPEEIETMYFKNEDDCRLTPFGKRLRMTSLDELPNFFNVLKGGINLVGPRPDIPEMVKYYKDWQKIKFSVKPGVTGLAQANGRGQLTFQETLKMDVEYVENQSLLLDLKIIAKTAKAIILRIGAF